LSLLPIHGRLRPIASLAELSPLAGAILAQHCRLVVSVVPV
jgi:hypothetical protein